MAYKLDKSTGDIIINGWENGIADSPYDGIADIRNINLISIPKEASVNFRTRAETDPNSSGTVTSADAGANTVALTGNPYQIQAIKFTGASLPGGVVAGTTYWAFSAGGGNYNLYTDYGVTSVLDITSSGTGTWATVNMGTPKHFTNLVTPYANNYFMVDDLGQVWSNMVQVGGNGWRFTGNTVNASCKGNGLASYVPSNTYDTAIGYVFVFRDFSIDYATITSNNTLVWSYGWNPATGTTGNSNYLKTYGTSGGQSSSHETFLAPDNVVYYCDGAYIGRFFEETGQAFNPTTASTYIADNTRLLPFSDSAQSLSYLGTNLMIGGYDNVIYPWDTTSPTFSYPLLLAEHNVKKLITVNTTMYIFVGNRGRIYYTNGTNCQLFKKIPDHISGTVEPYFTWGGACSTKNQLYFSALALKNTGVSITGYGGVWAIDLDTSAIRLTNKLSYGTYAGYASAIIPNLGTNPSGTGLFIGWSSGATTYGIDTTISEPYSSGESEIQTDLIPIGTYLQPTTNGRVEFKLSMPLTSGETVSLWYRQKFSDSFTQIGSTITYTTNGSGTTYSYAFQNVPFQKSQWIQLKIAMQSINSNPSYVRLTELRLGN